MGRLFYHARNRWDLNSKIGRADALEIGRLSSESPIWADLKHMQSTNSSQGCGVFVGAACTADCIHLQNPLAGYH